MLATASGDDGIALTRHLGADAAVDGRHGDIAAAAHHFAPLGADALLALAAGDGLQRCIDGLRSGGRVAFPRGIESEPKPRPGITIVAYDAISGPEEVELARLNQAVEAGKFEIPIPAEFPLAEANKRSGMGHCYGKHGFDALTHAKSMLISPPDLAIGHLFPPYTTAKNDELKQWLDY